MECLDYQKTANRDEIRRQLREWVDARKMERKEAESVRVKDIVEFCGNTSRTADESSFREETSVPGTAFCDRKKSFGARSAVAV